MEEVKIINNKETDSVKNLLNKIDWLLIASVCKEKNTWRFAFENIYSEEEDNFKLLDWRQDLGIRCWRYLLYLPNFYMVFTFRINLLLKMI